ncbi:MAG: hypothetical protein RIR70_1231 [Pseudomonadota bacterium]|jgi:ribonucleoside-diphosphate reductase alpha chain
MTIGVLPPCAAVPEAQPLSKRVLAERYLRDDEQTIEDVARRVARFLAGVEDAPSRGGWEAVFFAAQMAGFIPGGRINANAGVGKAPMLVNCFVQPAAPPERGLALACRTLGMGGGVGYDFSGMVAPVAAIGQFNAACAGLKTIGCRRCAQMAVLRCDHPEILDFIHAKDAGGLTNFNLSVAITDDFMQAVMAGHGTGSSPCPATIWREIVASALKHGEPGVLFIDTINRDNNLFACEKIAATNPCGEQPLPDFGACVLGALNLTRFVRAPFSSEACFDWRALGKLVAVAVRMLDNTLSATAWPLMEHQREALAKRRIGLGITGLADALIMLGLRYGTPEAQAFAARLGRLMRNRAYLASVRLAIERRAYPVFCAEDVLAPGRFAHRLPLALRRLIRAHGLRNSHLLSIAPTGSISIAFADNVSAGIEPVFAARQVRRVRLKHGGVVAFPAENFAWRLWRHLGGEGAAPPDFVSTEGLPLMAHLEMMAAIAPFIDAGISKTANLPAGTTPDEVDALLKAAWQRGVKGMTCFPWQSAGGTVLGV